MGYICLKRGLFAVFDEYRDFCVLLGDVTRVQCAQRCPRTGITHLSTLYPAFETMDFIQRLHVWARVKRGLRVEGMIRSD